MKNIVLIIAGGVGARMGQDIPKQFINVYDKPVIVYTLEAFQKHPSIDAIEVVASTGGTMSYGHMPSSLELPNLRTLFQVARTVRIQSETDFMTLLQDIMVLMISYWFMMRFVLW